MCCDNDGVCYVITVSIVSYYGGVAGSSLMTSLLVIIHDYGYTDDVCVCL